MRSLWLIFCLLVTGAAHAGEMHYAGELIARARALRLAEDPGWHGLLHYRRTLAGGVRSETDDPAFFNAADGKTNPATELDATLGAFFSTLEESDKQQNPQCLFVARYRWLKERLGFDPARLPEQPCPRFERWRAELDPVSVTLVFPAAFINSPASMYGHTLLRLDGRAQTDRTRLLDYAINFAAYTGEDGGLAFAWKGLMGGYEGRFSLTPYYLKIAEYNDLESRDIWEYELALTPAEIERLLAHTWELGSARFEYYFLDENCSYQLLWLLDVARPSLRLAERFPAWVIPADTIRAVRDEPGLVRRVSYRPSRTSQFQHAVSRLPAADVDLALALADGGAALSDPRLKDREPEPQARILDLAFDYLDTQRLSGQRQAGVAGPRLRELMLARSRFDVAEAPPVPTPRVRPDEGHGSARLRVGGGTVDANGFAELRFRGAYHDLLDPAAGYGRGAQIEFGDIVARRESGDGRPFLHRFTVIDVTSIAPRDRLAKRMSWQLQFGLDRSRGPAGDRPILYQVSGGAGMTWALGGSATAYLMGQAGTYFSPHLAQAASVGMGLRAGLMHDWNDRVRLHAVLQGLAYLDGPAARRNAATMGVDATLTRQLGLRLELERRHEFGYGWSTVGLHLNGYF
jgi:hypothetical protein